MKKLRACYDKLRSILGKNIEPYESVELVEKYRQYWKPDRVRILLLAESHVFTSDSDRAIKIPDIPDLPGYPQEYAKFVYCLGCGEKNLTNSISHPKRDGTPFWKILYSCDNSVNGNRDFEPILSKTSYEQRIHNKINLLKNLKKKGVWLVDASIVALYDMGKKPSNAVMSSIIRTSWEGYTREVVKESRPEHVIIIGKGVAKIIETGLQKLIGNKYLVIPQPNARSSSKERLSNFKECGRLCRIKNQ